MDRVRTVRVTMGGWGVGGVLRGGDLNLSRRFKKSCEVTRCWLDDFSRILYFWVNKRRDFGYGLS